MLKTLAAGLAATLTLAIGQALAAPGVAEMGLRKFTADF
jgi:hypothetical protein